MELRGSNFNGVIIVVSADADEKEAINAYQDSGADAAIGKCGAPGMGVSIQEMHLACLARAYNQRFPLWSTTRSDSET